MSRIDIGEIQEFAFQLHTANQTGRKIILGIKSTVISYIEDTSLKGTAVDASKNYYQITYLPLCEAIIEAMNESENRLKQFIQDFANQVDSSSNAKIDAAGLYELGQMIDRIESKKESLYQRMNSNTEGQMQTYRSQLAMAYRQENILGKYLAFEQSHSSFFDHLTDLIQGIQQTVRELQSNIQFNNQTGNYDLSKLNFSTVSRMRKTLEQSKATDTTVYDFASYSKVKQGGMWILSKGGIVDIRATEAYNTAIFNGEVSKESNQATEEAELLKATLDSLKQNKDPITGREISKAQSFGILTSLIFGYTTKGYRGKKLSIPKSALSKLRKAQGSNAAEETVTYSRVQGGDSKNLLLVNDDGTLSLNNNWKSDHNLNVSTGKDHAKYFKEKRSNSYIVEFEIPKYLDDLIKENAISQNGYKINPLNQGGTAPKIVDKGVFEKFNFEGTAYEIPDPITQWLAEYAQNAKILK
ncbi:hypothetical protein FL869_13680 [Listeria monocytogenes]|nr:hypothetical protein [Listeria monocytogenes]